MSAIYSLYNSTANLISPYVRPYVPNIVSQAALPAIGVSVALVTAALVYKKCCGQQQSQLLAKYNQNPAPVSKEGNEAIQTSLAEVRNHPELPRCGLVMIDLRELANKLRGQWNRMQPGPAHSGLQNQLMKIYYALSVLSIHSLEGFESAQAVMKFFSRQHPVMPHWKAFFCLPAFYAEQRNAATGEKLQRYFTPGTMESGWRRLQNDFCRFFDPYREAAQSIGMGMHRYLNWTKPDVDINQEACRDSIPT